MKTIGIILRDYIDKNNNSLLSIKEDLIIYLRKYQINVICIPVFFENNEIIELENIIRIIKFCDGIILPGGSNYYDIDLEIVKYLYNNNIPTLGICLGMQMMAIAFNGEIDYLPDNNHQSKEKYVHGIKIKVNSKLFNILNNNKILVNSRHNEHIIATDLDITAISDDMVIEAIEDKNKRFFIGIQWHPESLIIDPFSQKIFDSFINSL